MQDWLPTVLDNQGNYIGMSLYSNDTEQIKAGQLLMYSYIHN